MTENESILSTLQNGIVCATDDITREDLEMMVKCLEELQQYRAIGTVEGYKRAVEVSKENYYLCAEYKARLKKYEAIGTIDEFKALKEKVEPKKPLPKGTHKGIDNFYCPNCNHPLTNRHEQCELPYCDICGQKLDWSE